MVITLNTLAKRVWKEFLLNHDQHFLLATPITQDRVNILSSGSSTKAGCPSIGKNQQKVRKIIKNMYP